MPKQAKDREQISVTADLVILTVRGGELRVLLINRALEPFKGGLALPGGFMRPGENLEQAARRELSEETGLDGDTLHLEEVGSFSDPDRDPRGRVVTVAYLAIAPNLPPPTAGSDASDADWSSVEDALAKPDLLAFDHHQILRQAVEQARRKLEYTTIAAAFCPEEFTIGELRHVYEVVWGVDLDPGNFSRKVTKTDGFIESVGRQRRAETGRPAELYRRGSAIDLIPPLLRRQA